MYNNALVVGRFQGLNLDKEIEFIKNLKHDKIHVIVVTPQNPFTKINPFDFKVISQTLLQQLLGRITCIELKAKRYSDVWTEKIDELALNNRAFNIYMLNDFPKYTGQHKVTQIAAELDYQLDKPLDYNGVITDEFRNGIAYAVSRQFDKVYNTVDIAAFWEGKLLMGRKPNEKLWRFIGGFVDPNDENLEAAARREFREEANAELTDVNYICSHRVDDWRYQKGKDKIITTLFSGKLDFNSQPHAGDDIAELRFFEFTQEIAMHPGLWKDLFVPEHMPLMGALVRRVTSRI